MKNHLHVGFRHFLWTVCLAVILYFAASLNAWPLVARGLMVGVALYTILLLASLLLYRSRKRISRVVDRVSDDAESVYRTFRESHDASSRGPKEK